MLRQILALTLLLLVPCPCWGTDEVRFLSGAKVQGTVKEIRKEKQEFDFEVTIGGREMLRTYPFAKVHSVTMGGTEYVLTKSEQNEVRDAAGASTVRSEDEVLDLIDQAGRTPPDWYDSTPLEYPKTLDLSWPLKPPGKGWNNQVNMGQYIWDVINPNPNRWKSGLRLVHHMMSLHKNNSVLLQRDMKAMGGMYFRLLQDYPRAAYWLRQARLSSEDPERIMLAECYWRMGNTKLANELMATRTLPLTAIKLLGDMGQTARALRLADAFGRQGRPHQAFLAAGDACRRAGDLERAIKYYQRVLDAPGTRNADQSERFRGRAKDSIEAIRLYSQAEVANVADGTYQGISIGYVGDIEVEVMVKEGRITQIRVVRHKEKQFYAALTDTTQQILAKQSIQDIDATSRATITSQAIVNATAKALARGAR